MDPRDPSRIEHPQVELIRQRVLQICAGYEDANDCAALRTDPIFKLASGQLPQADKALGSQPTMSRLENRVEQKDLKTLRRFFVDRFIKSFDQPPSELVLDLDGYADPTHGQQELSFYHGYYRHHMYHPILINHAQSGFPLALQLRAGNSHAGKGISSLLRWILWRLKKAFPGVEITVRGDGAFSLPELVNICERSNVYYAFGYSKNAVLERKNAALMDQARVVFALTGVKARLFDDVYYQAGSWAAPRRIIMKAEHLEKGPNQRFVLTNREEAPQDLYDGFYVQRGQDSENLIKELKVDMKADRLSCHAFVANQFRLHLHQLGLVLMQALQKASQGTSLAKACCSTLRNKLIKQAVRVRQSVRRVWVQFSSSSPVQNLFEVIARQLAAPG